MLRKLIILLKGKWIHIKLIEEMGKHRSNE